MNTAITPETIPTKPDDLFEILQLLDITYECHHHDPIFTVEEGLHLKADIPGTHCRNLFLRDKKKRMFLITAANETTIDLKGLPEKLDCHRLSFGSAERLADYLGIYPGAVNPFCVMNDKQKDVQPILDSAMMQANIINVHPLDNAMTISIAPSDLLKFYTHTGHTPKIIDFFAKTA
ncbi:prolyl-tRNA synthetase associated domain-containing protein [Alphaproteobacteria bacterium]|nr:prolyl-tRNA synthetase associated domain-containing protein [Alphaproteobacteria bacterium]